MTISFTNSLGYVRSFSTNELTIVITNLNASNSYYTNGLNDLLYVRVKEGYLLLFDLTDNINRKIFESFTIGYDATNPFGLKFTHNSTAIEYTVDNALISVGFSGTTPISTLESQWMKLYVTTSSLSYLTANDIVKDVGQHSVSPAEIKTFVGTNGIVLSNDANNFTISINTNTHYTQTEIDNLLNGKQDTIADGDLTIAKTNGLQGELTLLTTNVASKVDSTLFTSVTNSLDAAILTNEADILLKRNIADSFTKTEVNNLLATKANDSDLLWIDTTGGGSYQQITQLSFPNGTVTKSNTLASVFIDPLGVKYSTGAYLDTTKLEFLNHTITTAANPTRVQVTATPAISDITGLQAALDAKVDDSQVLTNVPLNAHFDPLGVKYSTGAYLDTTKLEFLNHTITTAANPTRVQVTANYPTIAQVEGGALTTALNGKQPNLQLQGNVQGTFTGNVQDIEFTNSLMVLTPSTGLFAFTAQPSLTDVQDHAFTYSSNITSLTGHLEATGRVVIGANNDPMNGQSLCMRWIRPSNPSHSHYALCSMSTTNNADNFLRFDLRKASSGHNYVFRMDATPRIISAGACLATAFTTTSDESVKDDVTDIDLTPIFDNCNVKSYVRNDKPDWDRRVGFIAQDIQKACTDNDLPNTFNSPSTNENGDELLGLDYSRLVCVLWSKVKQLEKKINSKKK